MFPMYPGRNIIIPNKNTGSMHFGLFELADFTHHNLAMPVIHWGKFYEQMIKNIMEGNWKIQKERERNL